MTKPRLTSDERSDLRAEVETIAHAAGADLWIRAVDMRRLNRLVERILTNHNAEEPK